jgi:hypothetical protein
VYTGLIKPFSSSSRKRVHDHYSVVSTRIACALYPTLPLCTQSIKLNKGPKAFFDRVLSCASLVYVSNIRSVIVIYCFPRQSHDCASCSASSIVTQRPAPSAHIPVSRQCSHLDANHLLATNCYWHTQSGETGKGGRHREDRDVRRVLIQMRRRANDRRVKKDVDTGLI